jgi:hypothetical protein
MSKNLGLVEWMLNRSREADIPEGAPQLRNFALVTLSKRDNRRLQSAKKIEKELTQKDLLPDGMQISINVTQHCWCLTRTAPRGSTRCRRKRDAQNPNKRFGFLVGLAARPSKRQGRPTRLFRICCYFLLTSVGLFLTRRRRNHACSTRRRRASGLPRCCRQLFRLHRETGWRVRATPSDLLLATKGC